MRFKYLGIELSGYGDVEAEVREQTTRATKIVGCLNATIWRNKNIRTLALRLSLEYTKLQ